MLETSARLLRLLDLLQSGREFAGSELSQRLGVSPRTVRRDVDKLRTLGYSVNAIGGVGGGYQLAFGATLPPLLLGEDEAVAIAVGLRMASVGAITGIAESSAQALAKLDGLLPSRLRRQVNTLSAALVTMPLRGPTVASSTLTAIASAVRDRERLRLDYVSYGGTSTFREVEPYRLVHNGQRWYLFSWDVERLDWRTFRVDRCSLRVPNGPRFDPRPLPPGDLADHVALGTTTRVRRYQAVLTMHACAEAVGDEVPPTLGVVEAIDERTCTLRIGSDSLDQLAAWVAALGFEFEVREPPELLEHLRVLTGRLNRAAWPGGDGPGRTSAVPGDQRPD
ncbi:helix-turn-helix transcriptional regulator [Actinoalloteichus hymeniacidonis]|uniref:Transcriptional regulator n=1 Tax=Actinoalloteichus hymeniacidonis TaxID=340345 RepID=A0AAC9MZY0_9PSEU|nr:YafY family protein [Actinoalloteichus hymeniacidonis]AOS64979.1 putative transcriptional regulator [Actinoalloteichus hymeniacidonis]MBB5906946.1 putative DNA-binding transcriptional regulator YafY [Actinoalloteichus hymeniacidonis]